MNTLNIPDPPVRGEMLRRGAKPRTGWLWAVFYLLLALLIALLASNLWIRTHYFIVDVEGRSMEDTVLGGDVLYAERDTAHLSRGDVVVIDVSQSRHFGVENIIKRLIAVEGDRIKCEDGVVYLDTGAGYRALEEDYVKPGYVMPDFGEVALGEGEIFVMGDNRQVSDDSRRLEEPLKRSQIIGVILPWSMDESGFSFGKFFIRGFLSGDFAFS